VIERGTLKKNRLTFRQSNEWNTLSTGWAETLKFRTIFATHERVFTITRAPASPRSARRQEVTKAL
jgi:hypothetical protein